MSLLYLFGRLPNSRSITMKNSTTKKRSFMPLPFACLCGFKCDKRHEKVDLFGVWAVVQMGMAGQAKQDSGADLTSATGGLAGWLPPSLPFALCPCCLCLCLLLACNMPATPACLQAFP